MAGGVGRKRPLPVTGPSGEEESVLLSAWRAAPRQPGETPAPELPASLKRGRVDREVPLKAEVIRRDRPQEVVVSIQVAAALDPDRRCRWLGRALEAVASGEARASDLYDIVTHDRFIKGVSATVARRMMDEVRRRADLFPESLRQAVLSPDGLSLARIAAAAPPSVAKASDGLGTTEEILRRCAEFVKLNEAKLSEARELDARSFQAEIKRSSAEQVWGLTWSRAAFGQHRRVLEGVVAGTPAGDWNEAQLAAGGRPLQPGDELVAVNGRRGWEAMAVIRELLEATLTFVRAPDLQPATEPAAAKEELQPPPFTAESYPLEAGSGFRGHVDGQWLFSEAEGVYFHTPSNSLFVQDPDNPRGFARLPTDSGLAAGGTGGEPGAYEEGTAPRLLGRVRWFSKAKGFGFVTPWTAEPLGGSGDDASGDLFLHWSQVAATVDEAGNADGNQPPLLPGAPVTYLPAVQDNGKPCAAQVRLEQDLAALCSAGFSAGASARRVEKVAVEVKAHGGSPCAAPFAGLASGCRGVGGAEYVALNLARDLSSCLRGREQGGERGARAALGAALRQTQHGFLQYAQRLADNSATAWLSSETTACAALVFAPEADGRPRLLVATVGGGRAVVGRRDGAVAARLGGLPAGGLGTSFSSSAGAGGVAGDRGKAAEDNFKVFEKGLKGPAITFPALRTLTATAPRGFGGHAWSEKEGGAAGLAFDLHAHSLDWSEDALLILGSDAFWAALPGDEEAVHLALQALQGSMAGEASQPHQRAAELLMDVARLSRRAGLDAAAVAVLRFSWCQLLPAHAEPVAEAAAQTAGRAAGVQDEGARATRPSDELDDMFAAPSAVEEAAADLAARREAEVAAAAAAAVAAAASGRRAAVAEAAAACRESTEAAARQAGLGDEQVEGDADGAARCGEGVEPGQARTAAAAPTEASAGADAAGDLDDMFADFCREISGLQPGR